jgi:hypothetical protein
LAGLLVMIGLALLRLIQILFPVLRSSTRPAHSFAGGYLLAVSFGLSTSLACKPMVLKILGAAVTTGNTVFGAVRCQAIGFTPT